MKRPSLDFLFLGLALAVAHFALTVVLFCMGDPLANRDRTPSTGQLAIDFMGHPLTCISLMSTQTPFSLTLMALVADSLLWGFVVAWAIGRLRRTLSRRRTEADR